MVSVSKKVLLIMPLLVAFLTQQARAQGENRVVLSDTVTGNQEQPKVLYVVPWRAAEDTAILKQPLSTSVQNDIFAHMERTEHLRELSHLQQLTPPPKK
jgi:hypothetical protein